MSLRNLVLGVVVGAMFLAGCSTKEPGSPSGAPTRGATDSPGPTTSSTGSSGDAPKVNDPLDAAKFLTQPCAVLPPSFLQSLDLPVQGKPDTDSQVAKTAGPMCSWINVDAGSGIDVGFLSGNKKGLSDTYRGRARFQVFEPTDVDGYPAVFNDLTDHRSKGTCNVTVGISDTLAFRTGVDYSKLGAGACDRAKQVASTVIETLKKGA